jgi:hypothetical protein
VASNRLACWPSSQRHGQCFSSGIGLGGDAVVELGDALLVAAGRAQHCSGEQRRGDSLERQDSHPR